MGIYSKTIVYSSIKETRTNQFKSLTLLNFMTQKIEF